MTCRTLAGLLRARADEQGDALAIKFHDGAAWSGWSWGDYWEQARRVAAGLRAAGVQPGERALLLTPDVRAAVAAQFGAWTAGVTPIHVGLPYRMVDLAAFIGELRATAARLDSSTLLLSRSVAAFAQPRPGERLLVVEELQEAALDGRGLDPDAHAPPQVQLTSGSTSHPRSVVIPHQRLILHLEAIAEALPAGENAIGVTWLPLYHDMGLIGGLLYPFFTNFLVHLLSPMAFQARPMLWLEAMSETRATHTAGPPSAFAVLLRLASKAVEAGLRFDRMRCAMIGAEPIAPSLLRRFADAFAPTGFPPEAFFPVYGLAEATVAVTFPRPMMPTRFDRVDRRALEAGRAEPPSGDAPAVDFVGVGAPIAHTEMKIVDERGAELGERAVGEIRVRAATMMEGYFRDPQRTAEVIVDGWLHTGDLGYRADGALFIVGRRRDLIIKGGHNLHPEILEEVVAQVEGVRAGCVAAVGVWDEARSTERVVVAAETKLGVDAHAALAERIRDALKLAGIAVDEVRLLAAGSLPKTTSGKVRRAAVVESLRAASGPPCPQ